MIVQLKNQNLKRTTLPRGFTLVETLAAVSLLAVAVVAPMLLTVRSLTSAYYARDQITASYLAQEALEAIRQIRDDHILEVALGRNTELFQGIPLSSDCANPSYFTVDATKTDPNQVIAKNNCGTTPDSCPYLETDGSLYGYGGNGWTATSFKRSVSACYIDAAKDEARITVIVSWQTASIGSAPRSITISEDLYRWVQDGSGA